MRFPHSEPSKKKTSYTAGGLITFLLLFFLVRGLLFSPYRIPSGSMIPTLKVGDHIMASKFSYGWSRYSLLFGGYLNYTPKRVAFSFPQRGDIIVFANPNDVTLDFIKRVIGLPGDTIQMIEGRLHINGVKVPLEKVQEEYKDHDGYHPIQGTLYQAEIPGKDGKPFQYRILKQLPFGQSPLDHTPPLKVPEGKIFCMGDNWDGSDDSRNFNRLGFLPEEYFVGKALFIWFSLDTEKISLWKPWTWAAAPFKIRYGRILHTGFRKL